MKYSVLELARMTGGEIKGPGESQEVRYLQLDSRKWTSPGKTLFWALRGVRHDGHDFIPSLYRRGQRLFVVDQKFSLDPFPQGCFIRVEDSLFALQTFAARHRARFDFPLIAITGSNGKTIVKEWLFQLLEPDYSIVRSPRSYNSQVGVPLSVCLIEPHHNLGLFEAGISRPGEMERLQNILKPDIGILTNIGDAHDEGFASREEKVREKLRLFRETKTVVCPADAQQAVKILVEMGIRPLTWSFGGEADLQVRQQPTARDWTILTLTYEGKKVTAKVPFRDRASLENIASCCCILMHLGVPMEAVAGRLTRLEPVGMRLELVEGDNDCRLINDSYNSDLTGLRIALDFMDQQSIGGRKTVILSDIEQSGRPEVDLYREVAQLLHEKKVDRLIGLGKKISSIQPFLSDKLSASFFPSTDAFLREPGELDFREETILIKGARSFQFEKIVHRLSRKLHQAWLEVNLSAMAQNLTWVQSRLQPHTRLMVMVKAGAYGSGSEEVARMLEFHKVDYLAVAYTDEGVELRRAGVGIPILVLNPDPADWTVLQRYRLEPEIYSLALLDDFRRHIRSEADALPIHLKLDTGMSRLGFSESEVPSLLDHLRQGEPVRVRSVFSHLAAADEPAEDGFTEQQVQRFLRSCERISRELGYPPLRHMLNTAGILRFPQYQFEMVRFGIGLFGVHPPGAGSGGLTPAIGLKARVAQVRELSPGQTVGYSRKGRVERPSRIAVVRIGYADGLLRKAGNGNYALLIRERPAPIVGNVCMDMCMVDVTDIHGVREGDEVQVFGPGSPIELLAAALETIPYEILTNISPRVKRLYLQE